MNPFTYWAVNNEAAAIAAKFWRTLRLIAILSLDDAHVALLAPRGAPRVADDPVVLVVSAVADNSDAVVELLAVAEEGVEDARGVKLPAGDAGVDGNADDADGAAGVREGGLVALGDVLEGGHGGGTGRGLARQAALAVLGGVGVGGLGGVLAALVLDKVLEAEVHEATLAAVAARLRASRDRDVLDAVNEVLLGE